MTIKPITPLRQRMIEDMTIRRLKERTQDFYQRTVAKYAQHSGVDIRVIQAMSGHKKLETTAIYAAVSPKLIQSVEGPLDKLPFKPIRKKRSRRASAATTAPPI